MTAESPRSDPRPSGPTEATGRAPTRRWRSSVAVAVALLLGAVAVAVTGVHATASATSDGPMTQQEVHVDAGNGFGGGTIHYPAAAKGKLPAVVIAPALSAGKGSYEWNAAKLATYGFVAFAIDTNDPQDMFTQRRDQLLAAVDYLVKQSPVHDRVDGNRVAVEGHSASAVGALLAGVQRPALKAVVALAPVSAGIGAKDVKGLTVPSLLVCGTTDGWAPPSQCQALADGMPGGTPKRTVSVPGAGHGFPTGDDKVAFPSELAWLQQQLGGSGGPQSGPQSGPRSSPGPGAGFDAAGPGSGQAGHTYATTAGCGKAPGLTSGPQTIQSGGQNRSYILRIPDSYDNSHAYRLIFAFHWYGGTAKDVDSGGSSGYPWSYYGIRALSNNSAIFVAPQGNGNGWANPGGQDLTFVDDMVRQIEASLCVDTGQLFSMGFSYGGGMSYAIACARANVFRAVVVYSGAQLSGCDGGNDPIAYMGVHGMRDGRLGLATGRSLLDRFVRNNGCTPQDPPSPAAGSLTHVVTRYAGCRPGYPVVWAPFDGGHTPGPVDGSADAFAPGEQSWTRPLAWSFISQFDSASGS